jgi:type IX secretion system substrate protein
MKLARIIAILSIIAFSAQAQVEIVSEDMDIEFIKINMMQIENDEIALTESRKARIISSSQSEIIDYATMGLPEGYFLPSGFYRSTDSLFIIGSIFDLCIRKNGKWSIYEDNDSVMESNRARYFASIKDTIVFYTEDSKGPYYYINDSIYASKYEFEARHSFKWSYGLTVFQNKFYYFNKSKLIEFDRESYEVYENDKFAVDPSDPYFRIIKGYEVYDNKFWFVTNENYIWSFDGVNFDKYTVLKEYKISGIETRVLSQFRIDRDGNIWVTIFVRNETELYMEVVKIDKNNKLKVVFNTFHPSFNIMAANTRQLNDIYFDTKDPENKKVYISMNFNYVVYDPATDVLEVERIDNAIEVYPNPANEILNIKLNKKNVCSKAKITLYDVVGKIVLSKDISNVGDAISLQINNIRAGCYFLKLETAEEVYNTKVIIQ